MGQMLRLDVTGMTCGGCVRRAEAALAAVPGVTAARVNLATKRAEVEGPVTLPDLSAALARAGYPAAKTDFRLGVEGATCGSCVTRIEAALRAVPGVIRADFNLADGVARVHAFGGAVTGSDLGAALAKLGYLARETGSTDGTALREAAEQAALWRDVTIAAALTLPVVILAMGPHVWPPLHHWIAANIGVTTSNVVQFLLTTLVLAWPGARFFRLGLPALRHGAPDMNALVVLGTGAAWAFSTVATFAPALLPEASRVVYFEAAAVIVTLILTGRWLESRARGQAGDAIRGLARLQETDAERQTATGWETVPVAALVADDVVRLRPGARVPVDGVILTGAAAVDEAMLTGEPVPAARGPGDRLTGGTIVTDAPLEMRVTAVGADTVLARIMAAVADAQGAKLPIQALVDRVTAVFVPVVIGIAALTFAFWMIAGAGVGVALVAAVSVLVVACPCAMGLATPTSIMVGSGRASELGVLFRRGDALQALAGVDVVAFDKTGTLTEGHPVFRAMTVLGAEDDVLAALAALEQGSEHPVARAVVAEAAKRALVLPVATDVRATPGMGIDGCIGDAAWRIGAGRFFDGLPEALTDAADAMEAAGQTVLFATRDGAGVAVIGVQDSIRPEAARVLDALRARGKRIAMVTGDAAAPAQAVARALGIDTVIAGVLPTAKAAAVAQLQQGGKVAFVGDGINDAPALAAADVGIAMGGGTDIARQAADVVLIGADLRGVATALDISRRTMANIRQNLGWAFGYNIALIPVAAGLLAAFNSPQMSPMLASAAMAASSVLVITNALRLRRVQALA